jgi:hypothetical protein
VINDSSSTNINNDGGGNDRDNASGRNSATNGSTVEDNSFRSTNNDFNGDSRNNDNSSKGNSDNAFGNDGVLSNSVLSSHVSGVTVTYGTTEGDGAVHQSALTVGNAAFQDANGVLTGNFNTANGASQNASAQVAVGSVNMTPQ